MNRVVITGMGIYSCIGKNLDEVRDSLYKGKSGIILDPVRKEYGYRSGLTGFVERPDLKGKLDRRARIMLPEQGEYAYMATLEAFQNAGIDPDYNSKHEIGILYGNDSSGKAVIEANDTIREKKDTMLVGSGAVFQTMNSTVTMNLATIFKLKGMPGQTNYSAAKAGVIGATKALAQEIGRKGITVNAVAPGFIKTDMTEGLNENELKAMVPLKRFGLPEEVAHAVGFLASPEASYITAEVISVNGGLYS